MVCALKVGIYIYSDGENRKKICASWYMVKIAEIRKKAIRKFKQKTPIEETKITNGENLNMTW